MQEYVKYINKVLGVSIKKLDMPNVSFIHRIQDSYKFNAYSLNGLQFIFAEYLGDFDSVIQIKSQYKILSSKYENPVVLIFNSINYRQREALIKDNIHFVVPNRQIYIPTLGIWLQELWEKKWSVEKFKPSTQLLLTYLLNSKEKSWSCTFLQNELGISRNTISVDTRILESYNLISTHKKGVSKYVELVDNKKTTLLNSAEYAVKPFSKKFYINRDDLPKATVYCGDYALSKFSMLAEPRVKSYAMYGDNLNREISDELVNYDTQVCIKLWKYDYSKIGTTKILDPVSIYYELMNEFDERIKLCLNNMINDYFDEV